MENFQHTITASLDVFSAGRRLEKECKASRVAHKLSQSVCNERKHKKKKKQSCEMKCNTLSSVWDVINVAVKFY